MIGVGLARGRSAPDLAAELLAAGLVVNAPRPDTLRLLPPLTLEDPNLAQALEILGSALQ